MKGWKEMKGRKGVKEEMRNKEGGWRRETWSRKGERSRTETIRKKKTRFEED